MTARGGGVLVGRDEEVRLLTDAVRATADGAPGFVVFLGEAGIGKTRLLDEAAGLGSALGLRVLRATGVDGAQGMAYLPLLGALRACVADTAPGPASIVTRLLDGTTDGADDPGRRASPDDVSGAKLVEGMYAALAGRPTVLLADDLHWADASTMTLLDFLSQRARTDPLLVIAAARSDEPGPAGGLRIVDGRRYTRVDLRRLTYEEVSNQLHGLLGWPPHATLVADVHARSAGNPFFVEQVAAAGSDTLPETLRALLARRLASLDGGAVRVLTALAVLGEEADELRLAAIARLSRRASERSLRLAARAGVVVAGEAGYEFRHPLYREIVLQEASPGLRRDAHREIAALLLAEGGAPAAIARHWSEAGDGTRAFDMSLVAAEAAERAFAFPEARIHLERALELWPPSAAGRRDALVRAARATWHAGDPQRALALVREAEAIDAGDVELQVALAAYAWDVGDRSLASEAFERASSLVRDGDAPELRALGLWSLARARTTVGRHREGRAAALEARAVAREAGLAWHEGQALLAAAMMSALGGRVDDATIGELEDGLRIARDVGSPETTGHAYQFLVDQLGLAGQDERALAFALEGVETCERFGLARSHASDLRGRAALVLVARGRYGDAAAVLEPAVARGFPSLARGLLASRQGRYEDAEDALAEAMTGDAIGGPGSLGGEPQLARAELAWFRGDLTAMRVALDSVPPQPGVWNPPARARRGALAARLDADTRGRGLLADHDDEAGDLVDVRLGRALAAERDAEVARGRGDPGAPEAWAVAADAWGLLERPFEQVYARAREAEALFGAADRDRGREVLRAAHDGSLELGAAPLVALVSDIARRARVIVTRRAPVADHDDPTARELDVLALLADGLTNKQIAEHLFLSPKTVEIHVSRLLRKLDARTRGEAVAVARRRGLLD